MAAVWTGFDTPEIIHVGGNPAAQLWRKVMAPVHKGLEYVAFPYPQLGPNTGIFDLYDSPPVHYDEYADSPYNNGTVGYGDNGNYNIGDYGGGGYYGGGDDFLGFGGTDIFLG